MSVAVSDPLLETLAALPDVPPWLAPRRDAAIADFRKRGTPHRRVEDWKYSDLRAVLQGKGTMPWRIPDDPFAGVEAARISIENGQMKAASVPEGIDVFELAELQNAPDWVRTHFGQIGKEGMAAASLALMTGGVALRVRSGVMAKQPLYLNFTSDAAHHARMLIVVEDGAALRLLERHANAAALANLGVEIVLGEDAALTHIRLAHSAKDAVQVEELALTQGAQSTYRAHFIDLGARLSRVELQGTLTGTNAQADLSGAHVLSGGSHADFTTRLDHASGNTRSAQLFKHVVAGKSRAVYQGRITVEEGADGTDSRQTAKALLLDGSAEADLKPELIIFADDVKCAHGAAVGDLDAESLFYLRSRGIPDAEARDLLMRAFLEDAITRIESEDIRSAVWDVVEAALISARISS